MLDSFKQLMEMRKQAQEMQSVLATEQVTGSGAGGKITITMNGNQETQNVRVDPSLLTADQREHVEGGIQEALADARKQLQSLMAKKLREGGIPGM